MQRAAAAGLSLPRKQVMAKAASTRSPMPPERPIAQRTAADAGNAPDDVRDVPAESAVDTRAAAARRFRLRSAAMLALGIGLLAWFLWKADLPQMLRALAGANYLLLALTIAGNVMTPVLRAFRFKQLYRTRAGVLPLSGLMAQFGFLNMVMPMRSGEVAFLVLLKKRGLIASIAEALPRWIVLRGCDLAAVLLLLVTTALVIPLHRSMTPWVAAAQIVLVVTAVGVVVGVLMLKRLPLTDDERSPAGFVRGRLWAMRRGLQGLDSWSPLIVTALWSAAIWFWQATIVSLQYVAFRAALPGTELWMVAVGLLAISILPIHAPMSIGTLHAVQVGLLHACGVATSPALGIAIGIHAAMVVAILLQMLIGGALLWLMPVEPAARATEAHSHA